MTVQQIMSIKQIKSKALELSDDLGVPAFWLTDWLLHIINKPAVSLLTEEDYELSASELAQFAAGVAKMRQGTPLAYLTGRQAFWSLDFRVNAHTLIPRPDTEILIEQVLAWVDSYAHLNDKKAKRLLDLGTGSGCIAISLAHELQPSNWQVIAVDLSKEALKVARHNARANNTTVEFIQSSWYEQLAADSESRFDIIVSNPPYIDAADAHLQGLQAEPISALSSPNQGLADIIHIIEQAPKYLHKEGLLAIEHGYDQGQSVQQVFCDNGFYAVRTVKDYGGNDRVTLGLRS